jgi:hypothetical protein
MRRMMMKKNIACIALGVMILACTTLVNAQNVKIDSAGNISTNAVTSNAKLQVIGSSGQDGLVGTATGTDAAGVYGDHTTGNFGLLGHDSYGVFGFSSTGAAGYFNGNVTITGNLDLQGSLLNFSESDPSVNALGKAALSCADGEIPKVSGGVWTCSVDVDTVVPPRSESEVENFITNGPINLDQASTIGGVAIANVNQVQSGGGYAGIVVVATSGGDYTNPVTAMNNVDSGDSWCGVPDATNPCLLKIMPGVYDIGTSSLVMRSYVDIEGSGENVTVITGSVDNNDFFNIFTGLVFGADNAELRSLTVENVSNGSQTIAMFNNSTSPKVSNVTLLASTGVVNYGMYNETSDATLHNVTIDAPGSNGTAGIFNNAVCKVEISSSRVKGGDYSITASPNALTVVTGTKLYGFVSAPPSTIKCFASYDEFYAAASCP